MKKKTLDKGIACIKQFLFVLIYYKNEPCIVIKIRDERRIGEGNPLKRDGSIGVTRLIFLETF